MKSLHVKIAERELLEKQRDVLRLFSHVMQPSRYDDFIEIAEKFEFRDNMWINEGSVEECFKTNFLKREDVFSVYNPEHLKQCRSLIGIFLYANDYQTLLRSAVWARQNVNPCMFVYVFSIAIIHCKHVQDVVLPPIYEILPSYFFDVSIIDEAKTQGSCLQCFNDMAYYTEDVGYNAFYHYKNVFVPRFVEDELLKFNADIRGDYYYHYHTQILARYQLELESNGKSEVQKINYDSIRFSEKSHYDQEYLMKLLDCERRIRDAIDLGWAHDKNGQKVSLRDKNGYKTLGKLIEDDPESPNTEFYGNLQTYAHSLFGNALKHCESCMRDASFYSISKTFIDLFLRQQNKLGAYLNSELLFNGVVIEDFEVDYMVTFFDLFTTDISNYFELNCQAEVVQPRLNHKPFNYKIRLSSNQSVDALIKVYIGPKFAELSAMEENRLNFFELDRFVYKLQNGTNEIKRNSNDIKVFGPDRIGFKEMYKQIDDALKGKDNFTILPYHNYYTFPRRLMLPKGNGIGQDFQMFVAIVKHRTRPTDLFGTHVVDTYYNIAFPLDRPIYNLNDFWVPNFFIKDVKIYHESN